MGAHIYRHLGRQGSARAVRSRLVVDDSVHDSKPTHCFPRKLPDLLYVDPHRARSLGATAQFRLRPFEAKILPKPQREKSLHRRERAIDRPRLIGRGVLALQLRQPTGGKGFPPYDPRDRGQAVSSFCSSPDWYISRMISAPPTN